MAEPGGMQNVVERILQKYNVDLKEFIKEDLTRMAGYFRAAGFITKAAVDRVGVREVSLLDRAAELMSAYQPSLVRYPEQNFLKFISVLKNEVTMEQLAGKMEEDFKEASMLGYILTLALFEGLKAAKRLVNFLSCVALSCCVCSTVD